MILKAFTKLYAMAGVRLGYALCSDTALLAGMQAAGQPWAVSGLAQAAGLAALQECAYAEEVRALIEAERPGWLPGCGHWDCMLSRAGPTICCSAPRQTLAKAAPARRSSAQLRQLPGSG